MNPLHDGADLTLTKKMEEAIHFEEFSGTAPADW